MPLPGERDAQTEAASHPGQDFLEDAQHVRQAQVPGTKDDLRT